MGIEIVEVDEEELEKSEPEEFVDFEHEKGNDLESFKKANAALIRKENISKTVVAICHKHKYELMKCFNCPNIKDCLVTKPRLEKLKEEANEAANEFYEDELEEDDSPENVLKAQTRRKIHFNNYVKANADKFIGETRCFYERKEVMGTLQRFVDANYDLTDPRLYIILNELISNILNASRINKEFTEQGVMITKLGQKGAYQAANPLLKSKVEFSKFIIEATEAIDRILKSDEQQKTDNDFTSYLMKSLNIRDRMKREVKDSFDVNPVLEAEYDD